MKTKQIIRLSFVLLFMAGMAACNKKDDIVAKPALSNLEIGSGNSKIAYPGTDVHIEGEIFAPGIIAAIKVEIHPEGADGWKFSKIYTEGYEGVKNTDFHEHIDIPEDAATGDYHVHISITDKAGNTTEVESELTIIIDPTIPSIANFEVEYEGDGELHVEGDITAPNKIAEISVEVHGGTYEKEFTVTGSYAGNTTFHLHQHFDIKDAPAGHYHVHVVVKDQAGKEREFEDHFNK